MTETGNCTNRVVRGYGGYLVSKGPKGALSEEVAFKLRPEGGEGRHCVRIWDRGTEMCKDPGVESKLGF